MAILSGLLSPPPVPAVAHRHPRSLATQTEACVSCIAAKRMAGRIGNSDAAQWEQMNECSLAAGEEKRREICPYKRMHSAQLLHCCLTCKVLNWHIVVFFLSNKNNCNKYLYRNATQHKDVVSRQKEKCREASILSVLNCHKCYRDPGQPRIFHFNDAVDKEKSPCFQRIDVRMQMRLEYIERLDRVGGRAECKKTNNTR